MCLPKGVLVHNCASLTVEFAEEGAVCAYGAGQLCCCLCAVPACGHWGWLGARALCHSQPAGAQCMVRGHKCGGCLYLLLPRPCPEQLRLVPTASDGRTVFISNGYCMSRGWTDPQCSITVAGHLPCHFRLSRSLFVVWQSCACHPESTRQRLAAGHLRVIAEAVLEPWLLLRKA